MPDKNGDLASSAPVAMTPVPMLAMSTALPAGDALRAEIAALQQEAVAMQASINALKQREAHLSSTYLPEMPRLPQWPGMPAVPVLEGHYSTDTPLLLPALALALLLLWIRTRRARPVDAESATPASFVEKRAHHPEIDPHALDRDLDFAASDHHSDWGQDVKDFITEENGADSRFWEPEAVVQSGTFDSETAAVEVHKVRASLAQKRASRAVSMGANSAHVPLNDAGQHDHANQADPNEEDPFNLVISESAESAKAGLATVDLELDIEPALALEIEPVEALRAALDDGFSLDLGIDLGVDQVTDLGTDIEVPDVQDDYETEPPSFSLPDPDADLPNGANPATADEETSCEIKLALAHEFMELGLLPGAKEIATELMESPQSEVRSQASALLNKIHGREGIEDMPLFENSAFIDPGSLLDYSTSGQLLAMGGHDAQESEPAKDQDRAVSWRD